MSTRATIQNGWMVVDPDESWCEKTSDQRPGILAVHMASGCRLQWYPYFGSDGKERVWFRADGSSEPSPISDEVGLNEAKGIIYGLVFQ